MFVGTNAVKATAKTALRGNWTRIIAACCVWIFTALVCVNVAAMISFFAGTVISVASFLIMVLFLLLPIFLGLLRFIWRILFSMEDSPLYVFYWFSSKDLYKKAIKFIMFFVVRIAFWSILLTVPVLVLQSLSNGYIFKLFDIALPVWTANLKMAIIIMQNVAVVSVFLIMLKFYMAPVLFIADDNIDANEAMHMSTVISKKTAVEFIYLIFSFLGWILISILVMPLIFTLPYFVATYAVHVRFAVAEYNQHIKNQSENPFPQFMQGI